MDITGLSAIVTGGASGLSEATVERLAKAGAKVAIFDLNSEAGEAHAAAIGGSFVQCDVTDADAAGAAILEAEDSQGKARILENCAGAGPPAQVISRDGSPLPLGDFANIVNINLIGTFNMLSKFAARIHDAEPVGKEERGVIINTASVAAFDGQIGQPLIRRRKVASSAWVYQSRVNLRDAESA